MSSDDGKLDKCGCCQGTESRKARYNRPGLPSIEYRLDTHSGFFKRALAKLHLQKVSDDSQPLRDLTTRSKDDFAIALLDAWSMMADVITFYQERAANEGFLRTLQERTSALQMARAIGYELKPGVAASVHLAFTVEDSPGSPKTALVPKGLAVKSIPPPGKLPQTFETAEEIEAKVEWNSLAPLLTEEQRVGNGSSHILLQGVDTSLQPGDAILLVASEDDNDYESEAWQKCAASEVIYGPGNETVTIKWDTPLRERANSLRLEGDHNRLIAGDPILFERVCGESRPLAEVRDLYGDTLALWQEPLVGEATQLLIRGLGIGIREGDKILFGPVRGRKAHVLSEVTLLKRLVGDIESDITLLSLEVPLEGGAKKILIDGDYSKLKSGDMVVFIGEYRQTRSLESVKEIDGKTRISWVVPLVGGINSILLSSPAISVKLSAGDIVIFMQPDREFRSLYSMSELGNGYLATWSDPLVDGSRGVLLSKDFSLVNEIKFILFENDPWQVRTVIEAIESVSETLVTLDGPVEKGTTHLLAKVPCSRLEMVQAVTLGRNAWQVRAISCVKVMSDLRGDFTLASWEMPLCKKHIAMRLKGTGETIVVNDQISFRCRRWQMRILKTVTADPKLNTTLVTWTDPLVCLGETEDESFVNPMVFAMRERPDLDRSSLDEGKIDLEGTYSRILPGSWVAMTLNEGLCKALTVSLMSLERTVKVPSSGGDPPIEFKSKVKITRIEPDTAQGLSEFTELETAVFAQSEPLNLAVKMREGLIEGDTIDLDKAVYALSPGKTLIVSGKFMRGQVGAEGLKLVSSKNVEKTLYRGDSLQILKPPETVELLWTLEDKRGLTGTVIANIADIAYLSGSDSEGEGSKAQVEVKVDGLKLTMPKGDNRDLIKGEVLLATILPEKVSLRWTLRDGDGFEGVVTVSAGVISLQPAQDEDSKVSEVVTLIGTERSGGKTILSLKEAMEYCYDPSTFLVYANIARATHGEKMEEILGSGDGSKSNQRFELSKPFLTYVSAPTSSGTKSTLEVRVNGVLWEELPSLYAVDERNQSYVVRIDDDALAAIIFGDGKSGARLPTGEENVSATYRSGIGPDGEVAIESLTLLQSRPLGISEVTNPLPASGAAPPEELSDARYNAPLTVLTLDRIVSLRDFEYFVRSFAGIGKAQAVSISLGQSKVVHITIASSSGTSVDRGSDLFGNLALAIDAMRDPVARVRERVIVDSFLLQTFSIEAGLLIDPRYLTKEVMERAETDLRRSFSFENRNFAQFVTAAEVLAVIQAVEGVIAVDLDRLERDDAPKAGTSLTAVLQAERARIDEESGAILPAEMLLLNPASIGVTLKELKS